jgi:7-alpha-hydroxysteroid dehydrogenase
VIASLPDPLRAFSLEGRVAVVTGGGRGIGRQIALTFAAAGADLVLAARSREHLMETAEAIERSGRRALVAPTDVTREDEVAALAARTMEAFGRVDILVNNAGGGKWRRMLDMSLEDWEGTLRTNLTSTFLCSRAFAPAMLQQGKGVLLSVASISGRRGQKSMAHYGAAKAAVMNLVKSMAVEWAPQIRANAIAAGVVLSEEVEARFASGPDEERRRFERRTLLGRMGTLEDCALAALYLCSDASAWVTGVTLDLNGGEWLPG